MNLRLHDPVPKPVKGGGYKYSLVYKKGGGRFFAIIDADDLPRVERIRWGARKSASGVYAHATSLYGIPKHHTRMHAFILKAEPGQLIDHINGDTLDNRKANLRIVTAAQNAQNRLMSLTPGKSSRFKGVYWDGSKWLVNIGANGTSIRVGRFDDEIEAALAYDEAAKIHHGEFARTNEQMGLFKREPEHRLDMVPHNTYPVKMRRNKRGFGPNESNPDVRVEITPAMATAMLAGLPPITD